MTFQATEFSSGNQAIQEVEASGQGVALTCAGRFFVTPEREAERLSAAGVRFAYLGLHFRGDGRDVVVTVPVN